MPQPSTTDAKVSAPANRFTLRQRIVLRIIIAVGTVAIRLIGLTLRVSVSHEEGAQTTIGQRPLIEALERVKDSFNSFPVDCLALAGAAAAIEDDAWFEETCSRIMANREALTRGLAELGFEVLPSLANFVFARHPRRRGPELLAGLRAGGVLVRRFQKPRIADFLRITVGTEEECGRVNCFAARAHLSL